MEPDLSFLTSYAIQEIEDQICSNYEGCGDRMEIVEELVRTRRYILNKAVLEQQEAFLPDIERCSRVLRRACWRMYQRGEEIYRQLSSLPEVYHVEIACFMDNYPRLHPVQGEDRDTLWDALCDANMSPKGIYDLGINGLSFSTDEPYPSFEEVVQEDFEGGDNWNEGFDRELTENSKICHAFHNLFDHMTFALTDFLYVSDFYLKEEITLDERICFSEDGSVV